MADAIRLEGRTALVTGGAGAIGAATARLMQARGAQVAVADLDLDRARSVAAEMGGGTLAVGLDLEDEASVRAMIETVADRFGRLDILHNNAAFTAPEAAGDMDVESMDTTLWDRTFAINVRGAMIACRHALPHMVRGGYGSIINTVSIVGLRGSAFKAAYGASKAAVVQLTRAIATSHGRRGVRCNAVAPGMTLHPGAVSSVPDAFLERTASETPRDRLGAPDEIAEVVAFLASDAARILTGQLLVADGGLTSHLPGANDLGASAWREHMG
jgi:NAD(P)-dependent dehydrogenase (short-subunit alcohol dehydrogenase family)